MGGERGRRGGQGVRGSNRDLLRAAANGLALRGGLWMGGERMVWLGAMGGAAGGSRGGEPLLCRGCWAMLGAYAPSIQIIQSIQIQPKISVGFYR